MSLVLNVNYVPAGPNVVATAVIVRCHTIHPRIVDPAVCDDSCLSGQMLVTSQLLSPTGTVLQVRQTPLHAP